MLESGPHISLFYEFNASELTSESRDLQYRHHLPGTWLVQVGCSLRGGLTDGPGNVKVAFRNGGFIRRNGSMLSRRPYACVCALHAPLTTYSLFVETVQRFTRLKLLLFILCLFAFVICVYFSTSYKAVASVYLIARSKKIRIWRIL